MQNNNPNDYLKEDEIDLNEIFKLLINSKKLIITITLVITTLGSIYAYQQAPQYRTTALMEIGKYNDLAGSNQMLIEPVKTLIQELTINFIHKQKTVSPCLGKLTLNSLEDRLLTIKCESPFSEKNKESLKELATFIENRHLNLLSNHTQKTKNQLTYKIESINNELTNINIRIKAFNRVILEDQSNLKLLESNPDLFLQRASQSPTLNQVIHSYSIQVLDLEAEKIKLSQEKDILEVQLQRLEGSNLESEKIKLSQEKDILEAKLQSLEVSNLESEMIFRLSQEKGALELELEFLMQQNPTSTQLIGEIVTNAIDSKKELPIFLSFIFGLFLSIAVVFINNFLKAFKEEQV
jgi:LPS O-antigen subunit length determinant protein (WzzB/FepE family)